MTVVVSGGIPTSLGMPVNGASPILSTGGVWPYLPGLDELTAQRRRLASAVMDPEVVYRSQEAVRKVVDYLTGKFSRVPLHGYLRVDDTTRLPLSPGDPLGGWLRTPAEGTPQSRFLPELLRDRLLWDRWAALPYTTEAGDVRLLRLPPSLWEPVVDRFDRVRSIMFQGRKEIPAANLVLWYGRGGGVFSPMAAIQATLLGLIIGEEYRAQVFERGGRFPAYIRRDPPGPPPGGAPQWSDDEAKRFVEDFRDTWSGNGPQAGGLPLLEDGMRIETVSMINPSDAEYLAGVQLGEVKVCSSFHVAPELLGLRQGTYSNQDAFRESLYRETLGVYYTSFQDELNTQLVPALSPDARAYTEFLLEAALAGSFLEQATALQSAVGVPWLLRGEARAKFNLPPVDGFDEPIVPLNVLTGSLASPRDTVTPARSLLPPMKSSGEKNAALEQADEFTVRLHGFFARQAAEILGQLSADSKALPALEWDGEKWDDELSRIIIQFTPLIASMGAKAVLRRLDPAYDWSDDPMLAYLHAGAWKIAQRVNASTHGAVTKALSDPGSWEDTAAAYFAGTGTRAAALAGDIVKSVVGFGQTEAAKAVGARSKQWVVTSQNARESHAAMDGMVIPIDSTFPNGCRYPGDHAGSAAETAGCTCQLEIVAGGV